MGNCRSCGAAIDWIQNNEMRWIPMNHNGTCHFETCPHAKQWRNRKANGSHDYTKEKELADKQQTKLNNGEG